MKKHQHFIPKAYLKHFAHTRNNDTYLVTGYNKLNKEIKRDYSINDLCVETDLYTLTHFPEMEYALEDFFSKEIENNIPIMYKILVEDKQGTINPHEKDIILYTTLSMYFRTPKVLNQFSHFMSQLIFSVNHEDIKSIKFMGHEISIEGKSFKDLKKEIKENNRINYFRTQLEIFLQFLEFKKNDGIAIIELIGENEYITSDNPVEIGQEYIENVTLFDAKNSIYIPLDQKHALFIAPKIDGIHQNRVFYRRDNFFQHVMLNHMVYVNSERWVIGTKKGIEQFLIDEDVYGKPGDENHPLIQKMKLKVVILQEILRLSSIGIHNNPELIAYWKSLSQTQLFKETIEFQDMFDRLKEEGFEL